MFYSLVIITERFPYTFPISHKSTLGVTTLSKFCGVTKLHMSSLSHFLIARLDFISEKNLLFQDPAQRIYTLVKHSSKLMRWRGGKKGGTHTK